MNQQAALVAPRSARDSYWRTRRNFIYYRYVDLIVRGVAPDANSMIDVGSSNTSMTESFDWVPVRHALDLRNPYSSESVHGIKQDFLEFSPDARYDIALCLQVLEHIPDAGSFARKLFEVGKAVLISVPYKWPKGHCKWHVHDPVDEKKVESWTMRAPDYDIVVTEPFMNSTKGQRYIAYYHPAGAEFSLKDARQTMRDS